VEYIELQCNESECHCDKEKVNKYIRENTNLCEQYDDKLTFEELIVLAAIGEQDEKLKGCLAKSKALIKKKNGEPLYNKAGYRFRFPGEC